jgi:FdhE protein
MTSSDQPDTADLEQHIARVKEEVPSAANVLEAFEALLLAEARLKETLSPPVIDLSLRDLEQDLRAGIPLGSRTDVKIPEEEFERAGEALLPALRKGFPSIADQLDLMVPSAGASNQLTASIAEAVLAGNDVQLQGVAESLGIDAAVLLFVLTRLIKPFAEKWGESAGTIIKDREWLKGYCPLCGSWPNISFWRGEGGRRWLHCSFCGHEWTFMRTVCPFCENADQQQLESIYSEDRPSEAVDVCLACKRYLLRKDLREEVHEVLPEVAALGMVHLDALAQEQGFQPPAPDDLPPRQAN